MPLKRLLFAVGILSAALTVGACHNNNTASVGRSGVDEAGAGGTIGSPSSGGTVGGATSSGTVGNPGSGGTISQPGKSGTVSNPNNGGTVGNPSNAGTIGSPGHGGTTGETSGGDGTQMWNLTYYSQSSTEKISDIPWSMYTDIVEGFILPAIGAQGEPTLNVAYGEVNVNAKAFTSAAHASHARALVSIQVGPKEVAAIQNDTSEKNIDQFVALIGQFVRDNGYDGVDVDWEAWNDTPHIVSFITKLRQELPRPKYTLTFAATAYFRYAVAQVADELDQINIMAYDWYFTNYTGQTVDYAWYNTSILAGPGIKMGDDLADPSLEEEVWWLVVSGKVPAKKLGVLVPFYGRIAQGVTKPGDILKNDPIPWPYLGWAQLIKSKYWTDGEHHWDDVHEAPYISYYGESSAQNAFVTYTDPRQIMEFVKWAKANGLGGMGSFALPYEYLPEESGDARYPLSSVLRTSINATSAQLDAWIAQGNVE